MRHISLSTLYLYYLNYLQIWDLASGTLKLSLTGHISAVRGVVVSPRQPYLFSCGEDKQVKCWDLEYNKVDILLYKCIIIPHIHFYTILCSIYIDIRQCVMIANETTKCHRN